MLELQTQRGVIGLFRSNPSHPRRLVLPVRRRPRVRRDRRRESAAAAAAPPLPLAIPLDSAATVRLDAVPTQLDIGTSHYLKVTCFHS